MRPIVVLAGLLLLAPAAIAHHDFESTDLRPMFFLDWAVPGEPLSIAVGVYDTDIHSAGVPAQEIVVRIDGVVIDSRRIPAGSGFDTFEVSWLATPGLHTIEVEVDASGEIAEAHEDNNVDSWVFQATDLRPDLAIERLVVTADPIGMRATGSLDACNRGAVATNPAQPSPDEAFDTVFLEIQDPRSGAWRFLDLVIVPTIQPGVCTPVFFDWERELVVGEIRFRASVGGFGDVNPANDAQTATGQFLGSGTRLPSFWI